MRFLFVLAILSYVSLTVLSQEQEDNNSSATEKSVDPLGVSTGPSRKDKFMVSGEQLEAVDQLQAKKFRLLKRRKHFKEQLKRKLKSSRAREKMRTRLKTVNDRLRELKAKMIRSRKRKNSKSMLLRNKIYKANPILMDETKETTSLQSANYSTNIRSWTKGKPSRRAMNTVDCSHKNGGCSHVCKEGKCSCLKGFHQDNKLCIDINECWTNNGNCQHKCVNLLGHHRCACHSGFKLSEDAHSCVDIDECLLNNGHGLCQSTCINTFGSYSCACESLEGTRLAKDGRTCDDIDECAEGTSGCSHGCLNIPRGAFCLCPPGMVLGNGSKTCQDINECDNVEIESKCAYGCLNTIGSYICVNNEDILGDMQTIPEDMTCPKLNPPEVGYFNCSKEHSFNSKLRSFSGRELSLLRPGMVCQLECPSNYAYEEASLVYCGIDGKWRWSNGKQPVCIELPQQ